MVLCTDRGKWWRWGNGGDGKLFSTWCHKLREPGACLCSMCLKKLLYSSNGRKVLARHGCQSQRFGPSTVSLEYNTGNEGYSCHCAINDRLCLQPKNMFVDIHGRRKHFISVKFSASHFKVASALFKAAILMHTAMHTSIEK